MGALLLILMSLVIFGLTVLGLTPHQQPDDRRFCFAEWCIAPAGMTASGPTTIVRVNVRSEALAATQRPDHPQAWLDEGHGRVAGGPQGNLESPVAPGQQYSADLTFAVSTTGCARFIVSEGAWPPFLGLGYTPSPFTERAAWNVCV